MKKTLLVMVAGILCAASLKVNANSMGFGTIPGAPAGAYSGTGIPQNTSEYGVFGVGDDSVTISMAITQHGPVNPAPGNNGGAGGIGIYTVGTGLVGGRSLWNFDLYGNSALNHLSDYVFTLTITGNGTTFSFNPTLIPDNVGGPSSFGNSESLDFAAFGGPIGYNAYANDTYDFNLSVATKAGVSVGDVQVEAVAGTGRSVPDGGSTAVLLGTAGVGLIYMKRRFGLRTA